MRSMRYGSHVNVLCSFANVSSCFSSCHNLFWSISQLTTSWLLSSLIFYLFWGALNGRGASQPAACCMIVVSWWSGDTLWCPLCDDMRTRNQRQSTRSRHELARWTCWHINSATAVKTIGTVINKKSTTLSRLNYNQFIALVSYGIRRLANFH